MKKRLIHIVAMTALALLVSLGCSNKKIDTAKVRAAFQSLTGEDKQYLDQGLAAIDQSNYVGAIRPLKKVAYTAKMDINQRTLLEDTIAKVEARAAK
jgi:hypothetical protein